MKRWTFLTVVFVLTIFAVFSLNSSTSAKRKVFYRGSQEEINLAKTISTNYLEKRLPEYGIKNISDLKVEKVSVDELSMAHTSVQQTFEDVPVYGGEAIIHLNSDGSLFTTTDALLKDISVNTTPSLNESEAVQVALAHYGCSDCLTAEPVVKKWIYRDDEGRDRLVYEVELERIDHTEKTALPIYFIDAHSGEVVFHYNNIQTVAGQGGGLYVGQVSLETYFNPSTSKYYLEDLGRQFGTYDETKSSNPVDITSANNYFGGQFILNQRVAVDVHFGLAKTYDYFKNVFGRMGIDGNNGPGTSTSKDGHTKLVSASVHYYDKNNAAWMRNKLYFGDGDGEIFSPLVSLDVVAHEYTHGVTAYTSGLGYAGEAGALNESFSDVMGAMVERAVYGESSNTWKIGELCFNPQDPNDTLRDMINPHAGAKFTITDDSQPDHYLERYIGDEDNGGVHINSGIPNKAFTLLAKGGTNHLAPFGSGMIGIGPDDATKIWYKAFTTYMVNKTTFSSARAATINAANAIFGTGSAQSQAVAKAWALVGIGSANLNSTEMAVSHNSFYFQYSASENGSIPVAGNQVMAIYNSGSNPINWSARSDASWLTLSQTSGTIAGGGDPAKITLSVANTLREGNYYASITITAPGAATITVKVTLSVYRYYLKSGETLQPGEVRVGIDGIKLEMQTDGNLVLRNPANTILWASNTYNNPGSRLEMQTDGNLVMRNPANQIIWATNTYGHPGAYVYIVYTGHFIVTTPEHETLWDSSNKGRAY